ncbi:MAG: arylsulfatase [Gemmatimonadota bacterium]|nr:arylsulfatase [Gemmatimonadota bacterium]
MPPRNAMNRREFVRRVSAGSAALAGPAVLGGLAGCAEPSRADTSRPNVVLIFADDLGYSDIGCYGGELLTPNLDALGMGGLRFTNFINAARCCPSRACVLTGLYPHQAGVGGMMNDRGVPGYRGDLGRDCVTLAEVLKGAGYGTYATGKWHVTRFIEADGPRHNWPLQRGFDRYFGTITGAGSYFEPQTLTLDNDPVEQLGEDFYYTGAIGDYSVRFIEDHLDRTPDDPFFLYQSFTAPHWPLHATEEDIALAQGRFDAGWDRLRLERHERMLAAGIVDPRWTLPEREAEAPPWDEALNRDWQLRRMEVYAAQVESMDREIGRLVDTLRRLGVLDDTLILFLSDNGGCAEEINTQGWYDYILRGGERVSRESTLDGRPILVGNDPSVMPGPDDTYQSYGLPWANLSNTPFRLYKALTHTGGVATPLIAHWPAGISTAGELRDQPGHLIDIMPTLVELAGAAYPTEHDGEAIQPMEGVNLVAAFADDRPLDRDAIYVEHEGSRAVMDGIWKAVARGSTGPWELYDTQRDRTETQDLATRQPGELARLSAMWEDWANRARVFPRPG